MEPDLGPALLKKRKEKYDSGFSFGFQNQTQFCSSHFCLVSSNPDQNQWLISG